MSADRDQDIELKLMEFRGAKVLHARLQEVLDKAVFYLLKSPGTDVVNIVGPTGVGKSMLVGRIEAKIVMAKASAMRENRNMRPFVSVVAVASGHRAFDFKRLYAAVLEQLGDPFAKVLPSVGRSYSENGNAIITRGRRGATTAAVRERLERELELRGTAVWCVDEAQHAVFGGKSGPPKFQLEVFKSIAQSGSTKLCLIGPPELEDQLLTSGQLARRSMTIHFPRYRPDGDDLVQFASVAHWFFEQMKFASTPSVEDNIDFIYKGSLGCVGVMKDWFERAMAVAMSRHDDLDAVQLTIEHLRETRMAGNSLALMLEEIQRMERLMESNADDESSDRAGLSDLLPTPEPPARKRSGVGGADKSLPKRRKPKPGIRGPGRDAVGGSEAWGA